jgi:hypothetical protein
LHPHTLTFRQLTQPAPIERRGMNEDILAAAVRRYETEPFSTLYHLTEPRHSSVGPAPGLEEGRVEGRRSALFIV